MENNCMVEVLLGLSDFYLYGDIGSVNFGIFIEVDVVG